jgi:Ca2+-binding EF-hand superfamily protein
MKLATVLAIAQCLVLISCQAGLGGSTAQPAPGRIPFITEFKKIDGGNIGRITMEQAVEYYRRRFGELDRNGDGFLDAGELDAALPLMDARSGKELLLSLDRNSDGKLSADEFVVIANWLFQLAKSQTQLTLSDVEKG